MTAMIEIRDLVKRFEDFTAVAGITLQVAKGEVLGFLGPNGAGKSTTMKMVTGFLDPTGGSIKVGGIELAADPLAAKRMIGYLPEGAPAYPDMTPAALFAFVGSARGMDRATLRRRIEAVVAETHIGSVLEQPIETLSKGYKRRVGLAQAILHDPPILVLDEPTDGLDPNQKHEVRELIRRMKADKAIVISTHILEEVEAICDRAIIVARGKVVAEGAPVGNGSWRFGNVIAEPGRLDAAFRNITLGAAA
jgi:ABC-2 type transport system ATP-binding protein